MAARVFHERLIIQREKEEHEEKEDQQQRQKAYLAQSIQDRRNTFVSLATRELTIMSASAAAGQN